jgi:predicted transcriptional regulator
MHSGETLREILKERGVNNSSIIKQLDFTKQRFYQILKDPNAHPNHIKNILKIAKISDVSDRFPNIHFEESSVIEETNELNKLKNQLIEIQNKCIKLYEENIKLRGQLEKVNLK